MHDFHNLCVCESNVHMHEKTYRISFLKVRLLCNLPLRLYMSRDTLELGAGMLRMNTTASDEAELDMKIQAAFVSHAWHASVLVILTR